MKTIYIDLKMTPGGIPPVIHLNQYDRGMTEIVFTLIDDTGYYEIPNGVSVYLVGTKTDQTGFQYDCTFSGHTATITVQEQMTVCSGRVPAELRIIDKDASVISTANLALQVEASALSDKTAVSKTDLPMVEKAAEAYDATKEAAAAALVSEQNAKASETAAASSATAAATSEANAKTSETNAAASAQSVADSAAAAKVSEEAAAKSATAASDSASAASGSASAAKTSETNAKTSETNAASSATTASDQATAAANSASAAKTSETNAKTSETNAASSATTASDQATAAASSASAAKTSETNAASSASSASTSATQALESATAAASSATAASGFATSASDSATAAANSAKAAKASEDKCKALAGFTVDDTVSSTSTNAVMSKGIYNFVADQVSTKATASDLTSEISRAKAAEQTNATAISDETTRAEAAEKTNADNITANYNTQDGVNTALKNRITALEEKHTITELTISSSGWTAQDDGTAKYTATLTAVYERPEVYLEDSTVQVTKATYDSTVPALYLYAKTAPSVDFKIIIKGAK
ncbi:MAG: phage baseplate upper protein [Solobacterium sp.]|nr:phage baseplate upper protein [Solobacterium sp.]MCI1407115.1 phage baseplate upper protein [Solobacterium sp.]MCI1435640.1 phage baseplate upper protein [Solobacterium sp.]MCI1457890.1 phage baseplate upper protein [Solobacterium sp.]